MDETLDELLERFRTDGDHASFEALAHAARPLILSVCRRHLGASDEVEDAVQETLVKLARRAEQVHGNVAAWLAAAARTTCLDRLRQRQAHQRKVRRLAERPAPSYEGVLTWESALRQLDDALAELDEPTRRLVRERFMEGRKLRELADAREASVAGMHRQLAQAIVDLTEVYRGMGFDRIDDASVDAMLTDDGPLALGLRSDWAPPCRPAPSPRRGPDGWSRPIRVGVMVSYGSSTYDHFGWFQPISCQLIGLDLALDPRFEFIGLVEPRTDRHGPIERTIRDFDLTAGVMDASDHDALQTLDVIWLGWQFVMLPRVARAIHDAVRSGVGLFSQGEKGPISARNPTVQALLLSDGKPERFCTWPTHGHHHVRLPATVERRHPALPGLRVGDRLRVDGCSLLVDPVPDAQVLVRFDEPRRPNYPHDDPPPDRPPRPPIAVAAGRIGRGRVMAVYTHYTQPLFDHPRPHGSTIPDLLAWLAGPRRPPG